MAGKDPLIQGGICDRAREWTSLRLDGELSPLEDECCERHLEVCDECRAFEYDVRWATDVLRLTPQERPSQRLRVPVASKPRVTARRVTAIAATAALALGALIGALVERPVLADAVAVAQRDQLPHERSATRTTSGSSRGRGSCPHRRQCAAEHA